MMSQVANEHRADAPHQLACAVITVSDSRTLATDTGGQLVCDLLAGADIALAAREITPDEPATIRTLLERYRDDPNIDAVLLTG